ncbi:hypothetical protein C7E25_17130 [Stenotrophomonas maltophilia]|nr:hypothetical protein C7E25_17130 [Stenotrophomonas maltophilia]
MSRCAGANAPRIDGAASTINRTGELDAVWPQVCEEVLHYPALRNVRIQLNARPGVDEPVRWRQCATY